MFRKIIKPTEQVYTLHLPAEMVGKTVEVIAFEVVSKDAEQLATTFEERVQRIRAITKSTLVDLSGFTFNRDDANSYGG